MFSYDLLPIEHRGYIHLICSPATSRNPVNKAFMDYQIQAAKGDLLFRRWPLRAVSVCTVHVPFVLTNIQHKCDALHHQYLSLGSFDFQVEGRS